MNRKVYLQNSRSWRTRCSWLVAVTNSLLLNQLHSDNRCNSIIIVYMRIYMNSYFSIYQPNWQYYLYDKTAISSREQWIKKHNHNNDIALFVTKLFHVYVYSILLCFWMKTATIIKITHMILSIFSDEQIWMDGK